MKKLTLVFVRHGGTLPTQPRTLDLMRALNPKGRDQSSAMGNILTKRFPNIDLMLCSPALRTRQTATQILSAYPNRPNPIAVEELYTTDPTIDAMFERLGYSPLQRYEDDYAGTDQFEALEKWGHDAFEAVHPWLRTLKSLDEPAVGIVCHAVLIPMLMTTMLCLAPNCAGMIVEKVSECNLAEADAVICIVTFNDDGAPETLAFEHVQNPLSARPVPKGAAPLEPMLAPTLAGSEPAWIRELVLAETD